MDSNDKPSNSTFNGARRQSGNDDMMEGQAQANMSANHNSTNNTDKPNSLITNQNEEPVASNVPQSSGSALANVNMNNLTSYSVSCSGAGTSVSATQSHQNQNNVPVCSKQSALQSGASGVSGPSVSRITTNSIRANRRFNNVSIDSLSRIPTSKANRDGLGAAVAGCSSGKLGLSKSLR